MFAYQWSLEQLEASFSAIARIRQFADTLAEENRSIASDAPEGWPLAGSVQFKNLVASYTESPDSELIQFGAGGKGWSQNTALPAKHRS